MIRSPNIDLTQPLNRLFEKGNKSLGLNFTGDAKKQLLFEHVTEDKNKFSLKKCCCLKVLYFVINIVV